MRVVPFNAQVTEQSKDTALDDKLWAEAAGVLAWMVRGCLEWQRRGLGQPEAVRSATKRYQNDQDWLNDFLSDCCKIEDNTECSVKSLYECVKFWWAENGQKTLTKQVFNRLMRERGFKDEPKTGNELRWQGVRIT